MSSQTPYLLTPQDIKRIKQEIKKLKEEVIPDLVEKFQMAKADGDFKENEPYQILKQTLADTRLKLAKLEEMLKNHKVVKKAAADTIGLGDTVVIKIGDRTQEITLVSEVEANPAENKFSPQSPLGKAIMGKKVGETVTLPSGTVIEIVKKK